MTLHQAISEYTNWKRSYAPSAAKAYMSCLGKFVLLKKDLEEVTILDIASFIQDQSGRYKPRTVVYYVNILKDFFGYHSNVVNPKMIRRPKFTPEPMEYITEEEFERMDMVLDEWEYGDLQKKVTLNLLWETGIRVSELCDLELDEIENSKHSARIVTKKNRRHRWIMWSGKAHELLMRYIGSKICLDDDPALFTSHYGRITTRTIERWIDDIAERAGIERNIHPHMFRHGKAHAMLRKGADLHEVKDVLGHRTIVSTQMYTGLFPEEFENMAKKYI